MTREEFIEKAKELAIDFWTMNLRDGTYESKFTELLDEYEGFDTYGDFGDGRKYNLPVGDVDLQELIGESAFKAGYHLRSLGWEEIASTTDYKRWFLNYYAYRTIVLETAPRGALGEIVASTYWYDRVCE